MVSMKFRAVVFAIVTVAALSILYSMPGLELFSPPWLPLAALGGTWQGPIVLLSVPTTLIWLSSGAQSRRGVLKGLGVALTLFAVCVLAIWYARMMFEGYVWDR